MALHSCEVNTTALQPLEEGTADCSGWLRWNPHSVFRKGGGEEGGREGEREGAPGSDLGSGTNWALGAQLVLSVFLFFVYLSIYIMIDWLIDWPGGKSVVAAGKVTWRPRAPARPYSDFPHMGPRIPGSAPWLQDEWMAGQQWAELKISRLLMSEAVWSQAEDWWSEILDCLLLEVECITAARSVRIIAITVMSWTNSRVGNF